MRQKQRMIYPIQSFFNVFIGIDVGKTGGFAVVDHTGKLLEIHKMPQTEVSVCKLILAISERYENKVWCIEKAQAYPEQGVVAVFTYGTGYGVLRGAILVLGNSLEQVNPRKWKNAIIGAGSGKDKALSIAKAENLFPGIDLIPGQCRKPQDGMAEAALIAEWARRNLL